jgi:hydrogenase maturation protease
LIGVQAEELEDYGGSLRAVVRARIPEALDKALAWLRRWGVEAWERSPLDPPPYPLTNPALGLDVYERERPSAEAAYRLGDARFLHNGGGG